MKDVNIKTGDHSSHDYFGPNTLCYSILESFFDCFILPLSHILTLKEQGVFDGRNGWCILLLFAALPFLQLYAKVLLSHAGSPLWINTS